ncbi:hypothetical protein EAS61_24950 [Bradyrhizobium zhanjiangense]|uniref:Uncharacterized protein n=1 Tax=Bradyrhizobium zhanjiangense TaxID=1325107 RepID=A0A4Q0QI40_9BRAD|nr:hypothetical protein EAS61_24950 [Bradyrhizobium zhanjiangense]
MSRDTLAPSAAALPLPLAGEGRGEGASATGQSPRGENPHPRLRRDLSRKRETFTDLAPCSSPN